MDSQLEIVIKAQDDASKSLKQISEQIKGLGRASDSVDKTTSSSFSLLSVFSKFAPVIGVIGGVAGAVSFLKSSFDEFAEAQQNVAQLNAVLQSTGGVAGITSEKAIELANSLSDVTTYTDDAILSAENLTLTFTNIRGDQFKEATKTILDMSTALGQDLKGSAIQLGKALQDPVEGVTALRKVGVNFNETQQEMIKNLVKTGQGMKAQELILKELATEFGGSAEAAANTVGGQLTMLQNKFLNFKEDVGAAIAPIATFFLKGMNNALGFVVDGWSKIKDLWENNTNGIRDKIIEVFSNILEVVYPIWASVVESVGKGWQMIVAFWNQFGSTIVEATKNNLKTMASVVTIAFKILGDLFDVFAGLFSGNWGQLWSGLKGVFQNIWNGIVQIFEGSFKSIFIYFNKGVDLINKGLEKVGLEKIPGVDIGVFEQTLDSIKFKTEQTKVDIKKNFGDIGGALDKVFNGGFGNAFSGNLPKLVSPQSFSTGDSGKQAGDAKKLADTVKDLNKQLSDMVTDGTRKLLELKVAHEDSVNDIDKKMTELSQSYADVSSEGSKALQKLKDDNIKNLADIEKSMNDVQNQMTELTRSFEDAKKSDIQKLAEAFVSAQNKVADLKDQLRKATDVNDIDSIKTQLAQQEDALSRTAGMQEQYSAAIAEAKRRDGLTDLERAMEDFDVRRDLAQQEYDLKMSQLNDEITQLTAKRQLEKQQYQERVVEAQADTQAKLAKILTEQSALIAQKAEEQKLYEESTKIITQIVTDAEIERQKVSTQTSQMIIAQVENEIQKYCELAVAIQQAAGAKNVQLLPLYGSSATPKAGRAIGGPITQEGLYPLHSGEYVVPRTGVGGMGGVIVNINGGTFLDENVAEEIGNMIIGRLKGSVRV